MVATSTWAAFWVGVVAGLANSVGIVASAVGDSDYYPPGERDWTYYSLWGLSHVVNGAILWVAVGQWRAVTLPLPMVATTPLRPSSPPGRCLWCQLPNVLRRDSL